MLSYLLRHHVASDLNGLMHGIAAERPSTDAGSPEQAAQKQARDRDPWCVRPGLAVDQQFRPSTSRYPNWPGW
jgi:hypothetical protein